MLSLRYLAAFIAAAVLSTTPVASVAQCSLYGGPCIVKIYKTWRLIAPCYQDNNGGRALHHLEARSDSMTVETCLDACQTKKYPLGGVEFGNECWCGNAIGNDNGPADPDKCSKPCAGAPSEICGGPDVLNVYHRGINPILDGSTRSVVEKYKKFGVTGCWKDDKFTLPGGSRLLPEHPKTKIPDEELTVEKCIDGCSSSGYTSAGLEWAQECWCGNNIAFPPGEPASLEDCDQSCTGDPRQYCGGPNRVLIYTRGV